MTQLSDTLEREPRRTDVIDPRCIPRSGIDHRSPIRAGDKSGTLAVTALPLKR